MVRRVLFSLILIPLLPLFSSADDQQKAQKLLNQVKAMATDPAGRRAVSLATSEIVLVSRSELVRRRRAMDIDYGELFIAYELVKSGVKMDDIVAQRKSGKTIGQIAEARGADWKQIASEAKKLNSRLEANLLKHFANQKNSVERDRGDGYDPFLDNVRADGNVSQKDIEEAQKRYLFLHDHAGVTSDAKLDTVTERAARTVRTDPIRSGGPDTATRPSPKN
jgi:hypothetical protein